MLDYSIVYSLKFKPRQSVPKHGQKSQHARATDFSEESYQLNNRVINWITFYVTSDK